MKYIIPYNVNFLSNQIKGIGTQRPIATINNNNKSISPDFASRLTRRENRERNEKSRGFKISSRKSCLAFNIAGSHEGRVYLGSSLCTFRV